MKRVLLFAFIMLVGIVMHAQAFQWAKQFSGSSANYSISLDLCPGGEMVVSGGFEGTVDFDPGEGTCNLTSFGDKDVYVAKIGLAGDLIWVKQIGGSAENFPRNVSCDAAGNIYITGVFQGTCDMDPGEETHNFTSMGGRDIFIVELSGDGEFIWAGQLGGIFDGTGTDIAVAPSGNIYISGYYIGNFDFDPGAAEYYMTATGQSIFTEKLNSNHEFVWAKTVGGPLFDYCQTLCLDESENVYTIGSFKGVADFDPGDGTVYLTSAGGNDIYVNKLNSNGAYVWAKQMSGASDEFGQGIVYDNDANLYITGNFKGMVDFAPDAGGLDVTSFGDYDIFTGKMNTDGSVLWVNQMGGIETQSGQSITMDNSNNLYITGFFAGTADFNPGAGTYEMTSRGDLDIFVSKLKTDGSFVWAAGMGGTLYDRGMSVVTTESNVYTVGFFAGTADFDPGPANFDLTAQGEKSTFISKLGTALVGIEEDVSGSKVSVYPNPTGEDVQIELDKVYPALSISICNVQGQIVQSEKYSNVRSLSLKLDGAPGIYFLQLVTDEGQTERVKIVKK